MSIYNRISDPIRQALMLFVSALTLMLLGWALTKSGALILEPLFSWSIATGFLLLFGILNSIMSLKADNSAQYWSRSIYSFMGLAFLNGLAAWGISGVAVEEAESYKFIYLVVTVGFLVFISMVNAMKKIVNFAEREEWNQPKRRY